MALLATRRTRGGRQRRVWLPRLALPLSLAWLTACAGRAAPDPTPAHAASSAEGYPASGTDTLFRGGENRLGGVTGGFGESLDVADVAYRLGTGTLPVARAEVDGLLERHRDQIRLDAAEELALQHVVSERPAFRAWQAFFGDGGRVRQYTPATPEELARLPPSRLVLAGLGRYMPDRLLILGRRGEKQMEAFLFHEIQHYIFDKWDAPLFETGEADHEVIRILAERRDLVAAIREGRIPTDEQSGNLLHDTGGRATSLLRAGRSGAALEVVASEAFYRSWVESVVQRVAARNENNRRVRIVSMPLSNGVTLLFDERTGRESAEVVRAMSLRIPPDYRFGPAIYVTLADLRRFDPDRLIVEGFVTPADRNAVQSFVRRHQSDPDAGRGHVFSEPESRDLAHLTAYNTAIFQQALLLAGDLAEATTGLEAVMAGGPYQAAFGRFLDRFAERMAAAPGEDPGRVAEAVAGALMGRRRGAR